LLGLLFLLQNMGYWNVGYIIRHYWPLILVVIGLKMLFDHRRHSGIGSEPGGAGAPQSPAGATGLAEDDTTSKSYVHSDAETHNNVFGDVRLRFDGKSVRRFFTNNIFGDIDLDFSQAKFEENALLRVSGIFGDVEIRVPHDVSVDVKGDFIAGSARIFDDYHSGIFKNVVYNSPTAVAGKPLIRVEASIIFGDIRVHS